MDLKDRKRINNLPKYDIGKMPTMSGYQLALQPNLSSFSSTPGYNYNKDAKDLNKSTTTNLVTLIPNVGNNIYNLVKPSFTNTASTTATTASAATNMIGANVGNMGANLSFNLAPLSTNALTESANTLSKLGISTGNTLGTSTSAGTSAGTGAASTASAATSYVTGGIAAALGAYGMANDIVGYSKDRIGGQDVVNATGKLTASKYGQTYDLYGGTNTLSILNYVDALNRASRTNLTLNSTGFGAGIGSVIGTAISPGYGTLIGTGIGAISGALSGFFGGGLFGKSRKAAANEAINSAMVGMRGANLLNEAEAGSQGLRNQFNATHADKGKNPTYNTGKVGDVGMIHTSHGIVPGVQFGLAGKGESIYNPNDGTASVYDEGQKRVDNIPTGVPLNGFNKGKEWGDTIIFGNKTNPLTGNTFAEDAKPYSRILEKYNKEDMNISKQTMLRNRKNALAALDNLAGILMYTANCGKNKFDDGKSSYWLPMATHLGQAATLLATPTSYNPVAYNSFSENPYKSLMRVKYDDPTQALGNVNNATRQAIYSTNNAGSLSSGMKLKLINSTLLEGANNKNNVINQYNQNNNKYWMDWRDGMIKMGEAEATRKQQANEQYLNRQQEAYGTSFNAKQARTMSLMNTLGAMSKDWMSANQFDTSRDYQQNLINLYNNQLKLDAEKIWNDIQTSKYGYGYGNKTYTLSPFITQGSWRNPIYPTLTLDDVWKTK